MKKKIVFTFTMLLFILLVGCNFTANFDSNGGGVVDPIKFGGNDTIVLEEPIKEGYSFLGWYTGFDENDIKVTDLKDVKNNITLYAKWEINSYTITFETYNGSVIDAITQDYNTQVIQPNDPTKAGNTFTGWYLDDVFTLPYTFTTIAAENIVLYARWFTNPYTISFNTNGGTYVGEITQDYNSDITKPVDPLKLGHTFVGWYQDELLENPFVFSTMTAEDTVLYAKWDINIYTVSFISNGGTSVEDINQAYNTELIEPNPPTRDGYTFDGWFNANQTSYQFSLVPLRNTTLYAKWSVNQYTITFNTNGGNDFTPITNHFGSNVSSPDDPVKDGYRFIGWYLDENLTSSYTFTTIPSENITIYAKWQSVTLDVFIAEGLTLPIRLQDYQIYVSFDGNSIHPLNCVFTSSNSQVASVTTYGRITVLASGTTTISITHKGYTETLVISVPVTEENKRNTILTLAIAEDWYQEGPNNDTKFGIWYGWNNVAWCAIFVSWAAHHAGVPQTVIPKYASVQIGLDWYRNKGSEFYKSYAETQNGDYTPIGGDILFLKSNGASHTAIVIKVVGDKMYTIEGNTSNMVRMRWYYYKNHDKITGYGIPNYPESSTPIYDFNVATATYAGGNSTT